MQNRSANPTQTTLPPRDLEKLDLEKLDLEKLAAARGPPGRSEFQRLGLYIV
jgi:hypothetical protein